MQEHIPFSSDAYGIGGVAEVQVGHRRRAVTACRIVLREARADVRSRAVNDANGVAAPYASVVLIDT